MAGQCQEEERLRTSVWEPSEGHSGAGDIGVDDHSRAGAAQVWVCVCPQGVPSVVC